MVIGGAAGGAVAGTTLFATGMNAILFNPATTSWNSAIQNRIFPWNIRNFDGTMITYIVEGEILNNIQGWYTEHIGILRWLLPPDESMGAGERHGMAAVIKALRAIYELGTLNDVRGVCE